MEIESENFRPEEVVMMRAALENAGIDLLVEAVKNERLKLQFQALEELMQSDKYPNRESVSKDLFRQCADWNTCVIMLTRLRDLLKQNQLKRVKIKETL